MSTEKADSHKNYNRNPPSPLQKGECPGRAKY